MPATSNGGAVASAARWPGTRWPATLAPARRAAAKVRPTATTGRPILVTSLPLMAGGGG